MGKQLTKSLTLFVHVIQVQHETEPVRGLSAHPHLLCFRQTQVALMPRAQEDCEELDFTFSPISKTSFNSYNGFRAPSEVEVNKKPLQGFGF